MNTCQVFSLTVLYPGWWSTATTGDDTLDGLAQRGENATDEVANRAEEIRYEVGNRSREVDRWAVTVGCRPIIRLRCYCGRRSEEDDEGYHEGE